MAHPVAQAMFGNFAGAAIGQPAGGTAVGLSAGGAAVGGAAGSQASGPSAGFSALMSLTNPGQDADTLYSHLSQVAETCDGFKACCYDDGDLQAIAGCCIENDLYTLRDLLDAENFFYGAKPVWPVGTSSGPRAAGALLQDHLLSWRQDIVETARVLRREASTPVRESSRGRSRDRRRRHSRSRSYSRRSRSGRRRRSRSRKADREQKEVADRMENSPFSHYGFDCLPDDKKVLSIGDSNEDLFKDGTGGVRKLSQAPLEEWVPAYFGRNQPGERGKKMRADRKSSRGLSGTVFLEHFIAFWVAHGMWGIITPEGFSRALLVQIRLLSDKGPRFASHYFRLLQPHVKEELVKLRNQNPPQRLPNLDRFIVELIPQLNDATQSVFPLPNLQQPPEWPAKKQEKGGSSKDKGKKWERGKGANPLLVGPVNPSAKPEKETGICHSHQPHKNQFCKKDDCPYRHLDTTKKDQLVLWEAQFTRRGPKGKAKGKKRE